MPIVSIPYSSGKNCKKEYVGCPHILSMLFQSLIHQGKIARISLHRDKSQKSIRCFNPLFIREKLQGDAADRGDVSLCRSFNPLFIREKLQVWPLQILYFQGVAKAKTVTPSSGAFFDTFLSASERPKSL